MKKDKKDGKFDPINKPKHYNQGGVEVLSLIHI